MKKQNPDNITFTGDELNDLSALNNEPEAHIRTFKVPSIKELILFEDADLLIINKPPMIVSEQDNSPDGKSLKDIIKRHYPEAMLCHRLDKETSGCIIAALNPETYRRISMMLDKKLITKKYHAITAGMHQWENVTIELPIRKQGNMRAVVDMNEGKKAQTVISTIEIFRHYTLLEAQPLTGRFHQIRIHMSSIRSPLTGDALYGGKPFYLSEVKKKFRTGKFEEEHAVMDRTTLHARSLSFEHPEGQILNVDAPYPKDIEAFLKLLRKYDSIR